MPIVSISLNQEILSELDRLQKTMGFSGRSEAIRAGIRTFVSEEKQKSELTGNIHAILLVVHNDEFDHACYCIIISKTNLIQVDWSTNNEYFLNINTPRSSSKLSNWYLKFDLTNRATESLNGKTKMTKCIFFQR